MANAMLLHLAVSMALVLATVSVHAVGLVLLGRILRHEAEEEQERHVSPLSVEGVATVVALVAGLFVLHGIEVALYGLVFAWTGAVPGLADAMYFSTMTFGTLGYSDELLNPDWRIIAAVEGINGLLLIGWSTAFLITLMRRLVR